MPKRKKNDDNDSCSGEEDEYVMMMESIMKLPDDMFNQELLPYLTVDDIVELDSACMNHKYRPQLLEKISGVILLGDKDPIKASLFKWLGMRRIYLIKMMFVVSDFNYLTPSSIENNHIDQFRYTQHVVMRGDIIDDMAIFIISHCPCLLSIEKSCYSRPSPKVTDYTLLSIADHCTGLQSLTLKYCGGISDDGLITIAEHCPNLQLIDLAVGLITDASIISISTLFPRLKSLNLESCQRITDASIISISTHCTGLKTLNLSCCQQITNTSIISISTLCTGLQSLNLHYCYQISDASIISISENRTGLKTLNVAYTAITDASLIAIAKNCTRLKYLETYHCNRLSSDELHREFFSVSELRAVLLSIFPSLPF